MCKRRKRGWKVKGAKTCFTGPDAKKQAQRQLAAIKINQNKGKGSLAYALNELCKSTQRVLEKDNEAL